MSGSSEESYEDLVERANEIVKSYNSKGVGRSIQRIRLEKAKEVYKQAFRAGLQEQQRARAARSLFETDAKLCDLYLDLDNSYFKKEMVQASHYASMAIGITEHFKSDWSTWIKEVQDGFVKFVEKFVQVMREEDDDKEFETLYPGVVKEIAPKCSQSPEIVVDLYSVLIDRFLDISFSKREKCHEEKDFRELNKLSNMCYNYVDDVMMVLESRPNDQPSVKFGDWKRFKAKVVGEMSDRKEKVNIEQRSVLAATAFAEGERHLQSLEQTPTEDDWMIIMDQYLKGLAEIRDHQEEYDPNNPVYVSNSMAGRGYKLIGDLYNRKYGRNNADTQYSNAVKYGLKADLPNSATWFDEAQKRVDEFTKSQSSDSAAQQRKETQENLKPHAGKLEQIRGLTPKETLPKIYELFPPRGKNENEKPDFSTITADLYWKKAYQAARKHYNPDKVTGDPVWKAICDDISKVINQKYMQMGIA